MGCLSRQLEINKSIEGNQNQVKYHSTQDYFVCQPNAPNVKGNAIRINWPKADDDRWKVLDEEVSVILRNSFRGSIGVELHSFAKTIHAVCLEHFGAEDFQKGEKNLRTANRRQEEKDWLRVEQTFLKKRLKETPNKREFVKKQWCEIKEKILVIARAENARQLW